MNAENKVAAAIEKFLQFSDGAAASYFESCVHCDQCSEACHYSLSTGDAKYNAHLMGPAGVGNLCCGGGGGVSANPRAAELQHAAFSCKFDQFTAIDRLEAVVVPCANCRLVFEDALNECDIDKYEVIGLGELVAQTLSETCTPATARQARG